MAWKSGDDGPRYLIGKDGRPLYGPGSVENEAFDRAAHERRFHREMQAAYERWQRGDVTAFSEAMRLCERYERPPLDWLVDASKLLVERAMSEDDKRARREWRIAWTRWEMVTELRKRGDELFRSRKAALERERAKLKAATTAEERARCAKFLSELVEAGDDDRGTSLERARVAVSKSLAEAEDDAAGSVDAIKASYELIEDAGGERHTFDSFLAARQRRQERRRKSKAG
jgi:hypothetical protein